MTLLKGSQKGFKKFILFALFSILLISFHGEGWCEATGDETVFHRAQSLWQETKWDDAVLAYEEYLNKNPDGSYVAEAYMNLGQYLEGYSRFEEALEFYRAALEKAEGRTAGLVQMESAAANSMKSRMAQILQTEIASVHTKMGNYDQSIGIYRTLLQETEEWDLFKVANRELKTLLRVKAMSGRNTSNSGQCGKESLLVILRHYNIAPSDKIMSEEFKNTKKGVSLASIVQAASAHGLKSQGIRVKDNSIDAVQTPAILHLYPDHYVVLVEKLKKEARIIDPLYSKQGERTITIERLKKMWTRHAVVFNQSEVAKGGVSLLTQKEMKGVFGGHNWWHAGTWSKLGDSEDNTKQVFDDNTTCSRVGCPAGVIVNTSTLNLVITDTDDIWKGIGGAVVLKRTYNADDSNSGMFGNSWHFRYEVFVQENPDTSISLFRGSGKYDIFTSQGGGAYAPPGGTYDKLQKNPDGTYSLLIKNTKETYLFGTDGYLNSILDRNGNKIEVLWNTGHHITKIVIYYGVSLTKEINFEYNTSGQCSKMVLPDGRFATFEYNQGKLIKSTDAGGFQTVYTYDQNSYINSFTTPTGTFQIIYRSLGSGIYAPQQVIDPMGNARNYSMEGNWVVVTNASGNSTKYLADDNFAYTIDILDANGGETKFAYDSYGNRTSVTDPDGKVWTMSYNSARGNLTGITDPFPLGNVVTLAYDVNDNLLSVDASGQHVAYQYDAKNNLIKSTDALSNPVNLTYDTQGKLTGIILPGGGSYGFAYDTYGNLLSETDPGGHITSFSYDNSGHVTSRTDANGKVVTFQYDALKRMTKASYPDGNVVYDYDCCGLNWVIAKDGRQMTFQHDADNRLIEYQDLNNFIIQYGYDSVGNLTSLTYPGNKVVTYGYDKVDRLISVTDWLSNVTTYDYDLTGNLTGTTYPDNSLILQEYDNANRLKSILDFKGDATVNAVFNYTLDSLGNRTGITSYQPLNIIPTPANVNYSYDPDNRLLSAGSATFTYDNNGNLIKKTLGSAVTNYSWDYDNMLTQVTNGGNTSTYKYDALGNRIAKIVNSVETRYVVDPSGALSQVLAESDSGGNITAYYVYGLGLISKITPAGNAYYYHYDGIGSTIALTDSLGNIVNKYAYDAFGKVLSQTETISNTFKYVGRFGVMDDGNGLLYMRARYYDPEVGRFVSKDPIGLMGGINIYAYGKNNPLRFADPVGLDNWDVVLSCGALVAVALEAPEIALVIAGAGAIKSGVDALGKFYDWLQTEKDCGQKGAAGRAGLSFVGFVGELVQFGLERTGSFVQQNSLGILSCGFELWNRFSGH